MFADGLAIVSVTVNIKKYRISISSLRCIFVCKTYTLQALSLVVHAHSCPRPLHSPGLQALVACKNINNYSSSAA